MFECWLVRSLRLSVCDFSKSTSYLKSTGVGVEAQLLMFLVTGGCGSTYSTSIEQWVGACLGVKDFYVLNVLM